MSYLVHNCLGLTRGLWHDGGTYRCPVPGCRFTHVSPPDIVAVSLLDYRDRLKEAMRYVSIDPDECRRLISSGVGIPATADPQFVSRIFANLRIGLASIRCDPDVLRGYLYGAVHELGAMISEQERERDHGTVL